MHPTITLASDEFKVWHEYFYRHLDRPPYVFTKLLDASIAEMTTPEPVPMWFDASFEPTPNYRAGA